MRQRLLTQLIATPDLDYVEHFKVLSAVNLEIRRHGPTAARLLRKAILEMDIGNYPASLAAALDAQALTPASAEVRHQVAMSCLRLAIAKVGAIPLGPGAESDIPESATELLEQSIAAFREAARLNPDDEETRAALGVLQQLADDCDTDSKLGKALRRDLK